MFVIKPSKTAYNRVEEPSLEFPGDDGRACDPGFTHEF